MKRCDPLPLSDYRVLIQLDEANIKKKFENNSLSSRESVMDELLDFLENEGIEISLPNSSESPRSSYNEKGQRIYSLLTVRPPKELPLWFTDKLDKLLQAQISERGIVNVSQLKRNIEIFPDSSYESGNIVALWQGDITMLNADAIVNAANSAMLGCFRPFHRCIDNVIHSFAGPQVRKDCNIIIRHQGCEEGTGWAKITRAYILPSKYILHTVGPIILEGTTLSEEQKIELSQCYSSCLNLASEISDIRSIAFCGISTGVFGFPTEIAAEIALDTINKWLIQHEERFELIVFNVFSDRDLKIYQNLLNTGK